MSFWKGLFVKEKPVETTKHIALVFPASFPSLSLHVPEPNAHCTIMYLGTTDTVDFTQNDVRNGLVGVPLDHMLWAKVAGKDMFGEDPWKVPVLRIEHDMLESTNAAVTAALNRVGISDPSIFADDYKPHVSVSQTTWDDPPHALLLTHAQLWWGGQRLNLNAD